MERETKPGIRRAEMAFVFAIVLGLILGIFIKKIRVGMLIGVVIGLLILMTGWLRTTRK
jgi:uncharacterized membrane protein (UPF0136 family)